MGQAEITSIKGERPATEGQDLDTMLVQWRQERPDVDPSAIAVCGAVWRGAERLRRGVMANLARRDLDFAGFDVILSLRRQGQGQALSPSALAKEMMLSTSAMTNRLDRLEKRGLVARTRDPNDRRGLKIVLTPDGYEKADGIFASHVATIEKMLSEITKPEREQLRAVLSKILDLDAPE